MQQTGAGCTATHNLATYTWHHVVTGTGTARGLIDGVLYHTGRGTQSTNKGPCGIHHFRHPDPSPRVSACCMPRDKPNAAFSDQLLARQDIVTLTTGYFHIRGVFEKQLIQCVVCRACKHRGDAYSSGVDRLVRADARTQCLALSPWGIWEEVKFRCTICRVQKGKQRLRSTALSVLCVCLECEWFGNRCFMVTCSIALN